MCNLCEKVRASGQQVVLLKNGGITDDPHGVAALEFVRERRSGGPIHIEICRHEPLDGETMRTAFREHQICYCPFCGEAFEKETEDL